MLDHTDTGERAQPKPSQKGLYSSLDLPTPERWKAELHTEMI